MADEIIYQSDGILRPNVGTFCTAEEGKTRQEEKDQADINKILKRLDQRELEIGRQDGVFADVSSIGDFREAMEKVDRGKAAFAALPATVRNAFNGSPVEFVEAFGSPEGIAKLRELGVVPEAEEVILDRQEAAVETRAARRREARELAARVEAAKAPPK